MENSKAFYPAIIPEPRTILGLRLRALSLGHILLLNRIESPFFTEGKIGIADLATAILICSMSYQEGLRVIEDPKLDLFMRKWHARLSGMDRLLVRLGFKKPNAIDYQEKISSFFEYLETGTKSPTYSSRINESPGMECPSYQVVRVTLMRDLGISDSEIMDRPWVLCIWDFITLKALSGDVKMVSGDAINDALEFANRLQEKLNGCRS